MKQSKWRQWLSLSWLSIVRASRSAGQRAHQVAVQGLQQARAAGATLARKIISIKRAAGLDPRIMGGSARSVASRQLTRTFDQQWQAAYLAIANSAVPGLTPSERPSATPSPPAPAWPYKGGLNRSDLEAGQ